jgi:hypothetical protein
MLGWFGVKLVDDGWMTRLHARSLAGQCSCFLSVPVPLLLISSCPWPCTPADDFLRSEY